jgi:hypothetical protein
LSKYLITNVSPINEHLGSFQAFAVTNNDVKNTVIHVSFYGCASISLGSIPQYEIGGSKACGLSF